MSKVYGQYKLALVVLKSIKGHKVGWIGKGVDLGRTRRLYWVPGIQWECLKRGKWNGEGKRANRS